MSETVGFYRACCCNQECPNNVRDLSVLCCGRCGECQEQSHMTCENALTGLIDATSATCSNAECANNTRALYVLVCTSCGECGLHTHINCSR